MSSTRYRHHRTIQAELAVGGLSTRGRGKYHLGGLI